MTSPAQAPPISALVERQRAFFRSRTTQPVEFRIAQLQQLRDTIIAHQDAVVAAVKADLGRPSFEAYFEIAVISEINPVLKKLRSWMKLRQVGTSIDQFPGSAWIEPEPLVVALIIGPWNYHSN